MLTSAAMTVGVVSLGATAAAADGTYDVQSGDTLASIARAHDGVATWQDLYETNDTKLADPHLIFPGQTLQLTGDGDAQRAAEGTYTVQTGDTLASIARTTDGVSSWKQLAKINALADPHLIFAGQDLALTGEAAGAAETAPAEQAPVEAPAEEAPAEPAPAEEAPAEPAPAPESEAPASEPATPTGAVPTSTWDALAQCESSGDWSINTGNGYYGGLQFALSSWQWVGGEGYPHQASKAEQIHRAELLLERQGWGAWPACSAQLGLR